jgi:hypothetical protein
MPSSDRGWHLTLAARAGTMAIAPVTTHPSRVIRPVLVGKYVQMPMRARPGRYTIETGSKTSGCHRRSVVMPAMLILHADTAAIEAHRQELLVEASHRRIVDAALRARREERNQTSSGATWHPLVPFPADTWTTPEPDPALPPEHRVPRLHLGSTSEWLRWMRTYVLLWLAGVVFYLLLAAGTFIADGFVSWGP